MAERITYVSGSTLPSTAANAVHVMKMADAFSRAGHAVQLIARENADARIDEMELRALYGVSSGFVIRRLRAASPRSYRLRCRLGLLPLGWVRRGTLVYTRVPQVAADAALLRHPCILELHHPVTGRALRATRRYLARAPQSGLVVITQALRDWAVDMLGLAPDRVIVAADAADPLSGGVAPALPPAGRLRVGYLGHLYPGKGMELIADLAARLPEMEFLVVGGTAQDVHRWRIAATEMPNLRLVGHVPHNQTGGWLRSFDVALLPNQTKVATADGGTDIGPWTSPLKVFEYASAGLPIIASDLVNLREVLVDERTALLCPPEAPEHWVGALRRLALDPALRHRLGAAAKAELGARHTWDNRSATILAAWQAMRGG